MSEFWTHRRVCVTGGAGFLGSVVVSKLKERGCSNIWIPRSRDYDLRERRNIELLFDDCHPDILIHLAAVVGGIGANQHNPGRFFYNNLIMGAQLIDEAARRKLEKCTIIGTVCAYPKFTPVPFREEELWNGYPEDTNAPYGIAKKALLVQAQSYRKQYGLNAIYLLPANLYGPGDNFDLENSHVIPALIQKCMDARDAGRDKLILWGTGNVSREFLHVDDCAEGILLASEMYDGPEPVNLGTGKETVIRDLAGMIAGIVGFTGEIVWDASRPDGQPRRCLDVSKAKKSFGFEAKVPLEKGLEETVRVYRAFKSQQQSRTASITT